MPTALITGAAGGIGEALCDVFTEAGYRIIAIDRNPVRAPNVVALELDIKDMAGESASAKKAVDAISSAIGGDGLAALINNAAVQVLGNTESVTPEQWDETLDTNLLAPFYLVQKLLPHLEKAKGAVVNIASIHATSTKPGFVAYATSKAALVGLTKALAVDLGGRVRVNALLAGAVDTPMLRAGFSKDGSMLETLKRTHPVGRIGNPEEIAQAALYLVSPAASFITGAAWQIDGGVGARLHDPA